MARWGDDATVKQIRGESVKGSWEDKCTREASRPLNCRIMFWCFSSASCRIFSAGSIFQRHSVPTGLVWCLGGGRHANTQSEGSEGLAGFNRSVTSRWTKARCFHYCYTSIVCRVSKSYVKVKFNYTRVHS